MKCDQNLWFTEHHSKNWWILHGFRWFCNHLFCLIFRVPYCFARFGAIHHLWMITSSLLAWTNSFENTSHLHLCLYHSISVCIHLYCLPLFLGNQPCPISGNHPVDLPFPGRKTWQRRSSAGTRHFILQQVHRFAGKIPMDGYQLGGFEPTLSPRVYRSIIASQQR